MLAVFLYKTNTSLSEYWVNCVDTLGVKYKEMYLKYKYKILLIPSNTITNTIFYIVFEIQIHILYFKYNSVQILTHNCFTI